MSKTRRGAGNPGWKGGRRISSLGYVLVYAPSHPRAYGDGYVLEHRLVVERMLGRLLEAWEIVHHTNGDRQDNRAENLMVCTRSQHVRLHVGATA